jgi:predicted secreted hydrolase
MSARLPEVGRRGAFPAIVAVVAAALAVSAVLFPADRDRRATERGQAARPRLELGPGPGLAGFARATEVRPFVLPADHGPHFEYQTEWWYYTGNLAAADGRRFGFQLTFFRRGLSPGAPPQEGLATNQVYFAHFAITDVARGAHVGVERFARGAGGLAGATGEPFAVWLEDWKVVSCCGASCAAPPTPPAHFARVNRASLAARASACDGSTVNLVARDDSKGLLLDLELEACKPLVAHGDRGLSPKSEEPGNASYYVGYTRMAARGRIGTSVGASGGSPAVYETEVTGEAWFDHEWSTSVLGARAVGWDWFSLQLDDGRELMYFQIRRDDGSTEPASGGTLVDRDGRARRLARDDVRVETLGHWTSPDTGTTYPSRWRLSVPADQLDLVVEPWLEAQEMKTSFTYWEGAVRVSGVSGRKAVSGQGYVELTGYGRSMHGVY